MTEQANIVTVYALYRERCAMDSGDDLYMTVTISPSGAIVGHVEDWDGHVVIKFNSLIDAISKLRTEIAKVAPVLPETDGKFYIQRGNPDTGEWEFYRSEWTPKPKYYASERLALNYIAFQAYGEPGVSFRVADSNGTPLSPVFTVSADLDTAALGKLATFDIDRVYMEGKE